MKILIITAMEEELKPLLEDVEETEVGKSCLNTVYIDKKGGNELYYSTVHIGKVNSAFYTTQLINELNPDLVVNFGTAGGISKTLNILDVIVANETAYHDVDVTGFGYEIGQVPGHEPTYSINIDDTLIELIKEVTPNLHLGSIVSGDQFINDKEKSKLIEKKFNNVYATDMESCAIVDVCQKLEKDVLIIRGISDLAHSNSAIEFDKYLEKVIIKFRGIIEVLKKYNKNN